MKIDHKGAKGTMSFEFGVGGFEFQVKVRLKEQLK